MVWLHPGGNQSGGASDVIPLGIGGYIYDGRSLVENQQVIVVTVDYRIGVLGFFSHPLLSAEDPRGVSGNQGLLDQRAALAWVQRNIVAFGGDPSSITLFGQSAGSYDTCYQMVSPGTRGLFHRAISQSCGCTEVIPSRSSAEAEGAVFAAAVGCSDPATQLSCLRAAPVTTLMVGDAPVIGGDPKLPGGKTYAGGERAWSFTVTVDGDVIPKQPRALFDAGDFAKVPYIVGSTTDEGTLLHFGEPPVANESEYTAALGRRFGARGVEVAMHYPVSKFASPQAALMRVTGDANVVCGTHDTARRVAAAGGSVFFYNFDRPVPIPALASLNLGAAHGAENAYIFGTWPMDFPQEDVAVGLTMQGYWARLARSGNPNGEGALTWPAWKRDADVRVNFDLEPNLVTDFRRDLCDFWATWYDAQFD
jgi:para-nitrobenzyl esterase